MWQYNPRKGSDKMDKIKVGFLIILLGLVLTLVLSLFLVFAVNNDLPLLRSTGIGLLGFGENIVHTNPSNGNVYTGPMDFFNNVYGFSDNSFEVIGGIVKAIYWMFCITCVAIMCCVTLAVFMKPEKTKFILVLTFCEIFFGFFIVAIALISVLYPSSLFSVYTYSTHYPFLMLPLIIALVAAVLTTIWVVQASRKVKQSGGARHGRAAKGYSESKFCRFCGKEIMRDMAICGYCGKKQ